MSIRPAPGKQGRTQLPPKICNDCKMEKPSYRFSKIRYNSKKAGLKIYLRPYCKQCQNKRSRISTYKKPEKYLEKIKIQALTRRINPLCIGCLNPGVLEKHKIGTYTAYYHKTCAQTLFEQKGLISPQRKQELEAIINS